MCLKTLSYSWVSIPAQTLRRLPALGQGVCHAQVAIPEPLLASGRAEHAGWGCIGLSRGCLAPWLCVGVQQQWPKGWHCSSCRTPLELQLS